MTIQPIKVLVVDDSAIVRRILTEQLQLDQKITVVGTAPDPYVARDKIVKLQPDVVTLDLEMPKMDGLSFLKKLMEHYPLPVIILSSYTERGCHNALKALELGAVEVLQKPGGSHSVAEMGHELIDKIKIAAKAKFVHPEPHQGPVTPIVAGDKNALKKIVAIGSSTGGTQALKTIFTRLPATIPGIVVVQHMPAQFTKMFADHLNEECSMQIKEAEDGDQVLPGKVLIAPGGKHMLLARSSTGYVVRLRGGGQVCYHKPSVEVLFRSVAREAGSNAIGVILTGMGYDGSKGLLEMKKAGATTIAQDEKSCVVFGMPREAIALGAVDKVMPLANIAEEILKSAMLSVNR